MGAAASPAADLVAAQRVRGGEFTTEEAKKAKKNHHT